MRFKVCVGLKTKGRIGRYLSQEKKLELDEQHRWLSSLPRLSENGANLTGEKKWGETWDGARRGRGGGSELRRRRIRGRT